jgi:DNA-binding transcriptional MocR family regulator
MTTDTKEPNERNDWLGQRLRNTWEKVATVLAVIGLIDVSGQLIHWAELIHWIAEHYAAVRTWLFGWLPFHIPVEWHDPIVLFFIFFECDECWRISENWIFCYLPYGAKDRYRYEYH